MLASCTHQPRFLAGEAQSPSQQRGLECGPRCLWRCTTLGGVAANRPDRCVVGCFKAPKTGDHQSSIFDQLPIVNHHVSSCIINHQLGDAFNYFFFIFHPDPWGNDPIWYVSNGLKPPTSQWLINYQELIISDHHVSSSLCIKMYQCIYHLSPYIVIDGDSAGVLSQQQYNMIQCTDIIWVFMVWYNIIWYIMILVCFYIM